MIGKKIVCMRKNAEIKCLPQGKKLSAETTYVMNDLENFLKKLPAQPEWKEKTCKRSVDGGKKISAS